MTALVREAMAAGAVGFATSTAERTTARAACRCPRAWPTTRELRALVRRWARAARGVYMLTKGGKTSIPFLEELAAEARRPVVIAALLHSNTNPTAAFTTLDQVNAARARGHQLVAQSSCCPLSMDFTFKSPYLFESMQAWKPAMAAHGEDALKKVYRDPAWRAAVRKRTRRAARGRLVFNGEWDKLFVVETAKAENRGSKARPWPSWRSRPARIRSTSSSTSRCRRTSTRCSWPSSCTTTRRRSAGSWPTRTPTSRCRDAGAHLTFFCDAGFGLHLLGHWSRELGVLDLPQAVRRLTGQPAKLFGIRDRGPLARRLCRRPDAVRSQDGGARRRSGACTTCRPARRGSPPARSACTASGSTARTWPTQKGFCVDKTARPGEVIRQFAA